MKSWLIGMLLVSMMLRLANMSSAATTAEPEKFGMGASRETVLKLVGMPEHRSDLDVDGKEIWYYGRARISFVKGKVVGWAGYPEQTPAVPVTAKPLTLGASKNDVFLRFGFPPSARLLTALTIGKRPSGNEEWSYKAGVMIFQDDLLIGWRNLATTQISIGDPVEGAPRVIIGMPAKDVIAFAGTPPALTVYLDNGDQYWAYLGGQVYLRDGKVAWVQTPDATLPIDAGQPGGATTGATTTTAPPTTLTAPQEKEIGFTEETDFATFRIAYRPIFDKIVNQNPKIMETTAYNAMRDCLNGESWLAIRTRANLDDAYDAGVERIFQSYLEYLKTKDKYKTTR